MGAGRTHAFESAKADGGDATLVKPSDWNADHIGSDIEDRDLTTVNVVSTVVETSVYSHSLPAGLLGDDGGFRLTIGGDALVNAAGTATIRIKLGTTTVLTSSALDLVNTADRYKFWLEILCMNSSAAAQKWAVSLQLVAGAADFPWQLGGNDGATAGAGYNSSAEDTTAAKTVDVTVEWSASSASLSFRKEMALLELLPAA